MQTLTKEDVKQIVSMFARKTAGNLVQLIEGEEGKEFHLYHKAKNKDGVEVDTLLLTEAGGPV